MRKFNYFIAVLFISFMFIIKVDKIKAVNFGSIGESDIGNFENCYGQYNGCIVLYGYKYTIIKNFSSNDSGAYYNKVTNGFIDTKNSGIPSGIDSEIKKGGTLFESILSNSNISKDEFFNNKYFILAEPYFEIRYNNNGEVRKRGLAVDIAEHIIDLVDNKGGFSKYTGFWSVNQMIPCTAYIPGSSSSDDKYCKEAHTHDHKKKYLEMAVNNGRYGKWIIYANDITKPVIPKYNLTINKRDGNSPKSNVLFTVQGNGVSKTCTTLSNGSCVIKDLTSGNYKVIETVPRGYDAKEIKCDGCTSTDKNVLNVTISGNKSITVTNKKTCQSEFEVLVNKSNKIARIDLYKKYGFTNLLNFNITNADGACTNNTSCNNNVNFGCLSANTRNNSGFNANNLSCFTETITVGSYTGYCRPTFTLQNDLTNKTTYSFGNGFTAGQMVLNRNSSQSIIATGIIEKTCYVYGQKDMTSTVKNESNASYSNYVTGLYFNGVLLDRVNLNNSTWNREGIDGGYVYTKKMNTSYRLKPVYSDLGTGKINYNKCDNHKCIFLGYGFASKLNDKAYTPIDVPFSITVNMPKTTIGSTKNKCSYTIRNSEIIPNDPRPGTPNNGDLNIEFRIIDTENPFPGKSALGRTVGENWRAKSFDLNKDGRVTNLDVNLLKSQMVLGGGGNLSYDLNNDGVVDYMDYNILNWANKNKMASVKTDKSSSNALIKYIMANTNDSYNKKKTGPIYKITLTPDTIKKIRKYNDSSNYDDNTLTCKADAINCKSTFLEKFNIKRLK